MEVGISTPVLRYSEEPDRTREASGSSEYLRTGVGWAIIVVIKLMFFAILHPLSSILAFKHCTD
jgi:hypothetical protein